MLDILVVISVIIIYIMLQKFAKIPQPLFLIGLALFSLIIYYPGVPQDDTTFIYQNFITGNYSDWQPPIYSLWWHLFHFKAADFIMNMVLYYSGLIYISYVLYRKKLHWQNNLLILFCFYPLYATQLVILLKDVPYTGFLILSVAILLALQVYKSKLLRIVLWTAYFCVIFLAIGFKYNGFFAVYPMLAFGVYLVLQDLKLNRLGIKPIYTTIGILLLALSVDALCVVANNVITYSMFDAKKSHSSLMVMYNDLANIECSSGSEVIPDEYFIADDRRGIMCNQFFINYRNYEPLMVPNWSGANNPAIFDYNMDGVDEVQFEKVRDTWLHVILSNLDDYAVYRAKFLSTIVFTQWWWTPLSINNPSNIEVKLSNLIVEERRTLGTFNALLLILGNLLVLVYCLWYKKSRLALMIILSSILQLVSLYLVLGVPAARFFLWDYIAVFLALALANLKFNSQNNKEPIKSIGLVNKTKGKKFK